MASDRHYMPDVIYKIYISSEASLTYVHTIQIFPVHIGVCNLPTHAIAARDSTQDT